MDIRDFMRTYGGAARPIRGIVADWQTAELRQLLDAVNPPPVPDGATARVGRIIGESVGDATIIGDVFRGGTLLDEIPRDLRDAFVALMGDDPRDYRLMRRRLVEHLVGHDGEYMPFDDPRVMGFVNKIKGQIGENVFQRHVGSAATLAASGSQEGWDVAVQQADGSHEYVQVKLYQSASDVVRHMRHVQHKILEGTLTGVGDEQVGQIFFAVPDDIHDDVLRLAERYPGLAEMVYRETIPITASDAAQVVQDGLMNVGPEQLTHFFGQLLAGAAVAGSLHVAVNGFLWYKGSKEFAAAVGDTAAETAVSALGIGMALMAEKAFDAAFTAGGIGMVARTLLKRAARSRWKFADFLAASATDTRRHLATVTLCR